MAPINETNIKESFRHVKEHMIGIEIRLLSLEEAVKQQKEILNLLLEKTPKEVPETPNFQSSTGNNGVKQSITHSLTHSTINQSLSSQALKHHIDEPLKGPESAKEAIRKIFPAFDPGEDSTMTPRSPITPGKRPDNESFHNYMVRMDKLFRSLPNQELKLFLTIYQLEEDGAKDIGYTEIANGLQLSENCVRSYISFLRKLGAPLKIMKFNNRRTIFAIDEGFKSLNLKQKLVDLYYSTDHRQKKLFDSI